VSQIGTLIQTLAKGGPVMIPLLGCSVVALAGVGKLAIAVTPREARR
jgi:hypothetical protein